MNERILRILIESFWQILLPGLTMTIPLTILSFTFGLILALLAAFSAAVCDLLRSAQFGNYTRRVSFGGDRVFRQYRSVCRGNNPCRD